MDSTGPSPVLRIAMSNGGSAHQVSRGVTVVGRGSTADLSLDSPSVSRRHAELTWDGIRLRVRDVGSSNGTRVNGDPVSGWRDLRDRDMVQFGRVEGVVEAAALVPQSPPPEPREYLPEPREYLPEPREYLPVSREYLPEPLPDPGPGPDRRLSDVPIFVSHSSEDKSVARLVARYLNRTGWSVWIDEAGIAGGKDWRGELIQALQPTWLVILLVSYQSMRSRWVVREIQAADWLGLRVVPVVIEDAPYPDSLRMVLAGVQQVFLTDLNDEDRRTQQLARLDHAVLEAARAGRQAEPGLFLIRLGGLLRALGTVGVLIGFALFIYLGFTEVDTPSSAGRIPPVIYGFALFVSSAVVAAVGEAIRRAGLKRGI
jgi:pSer/pThr/pTyr-binding forkhead associated (FHA) protein